MGADLIAAYLVKERGKALDWEAGERALNAMSPDEVEAAIQEVRPWAPEQPPHEEARQMLADLREVLEPTVTTLPNGTKITEYGRGMMVIDARDATIYVAGGTSWGDDPCPEFTVFNDVLVLTEALAAIGFDTGREGD